MATLQLVQALQSGLVDPTTGAVLASGKCRFYDVGTLTPQTVYSDSVGASPITQPLTLTAGGVGTVYTANPCRCIVKDSSDVGTVYDIAVINGIVPATQFITSTSFNGGAQTTLQTILDNVDNSFGGTDWKYKAGSAEVNVKDALVEYGLTAADYGVLGDDSTDNVLTFQNAITSAGARAVRIVLSDGTFRVSAAMNVTAGELEIVGQGASRTIIKTTSATANLFTCTSRLALRNLTLSGASTGYAVSASAGATIVLDGVETAGNGFARVLNLSATSAFVVGSTKISPANTGTGIVAATPGAGLRLVIANASVDGGGTYSVDSDIDTWVSNAAIGVQSDKSLRQTSGGTLNITGTTVGGGTNGSLVIGSGATVVNAGGNNMKLTTDGRTASPVAFVLAGTNSVTPLPYQSPVTKIVQGGAAATTTINAPAGTYPFGFLHTVVCSNTSGGALTWTFNAAFKTSAAVAPGTGNRITLLFYYDPVDAKWSEVTRSAAVPN